MVCENVHVAAGFFYGLPEQPIKSIKLENIQFTYAKNPQEGIPAMMSYLDPMKAQGLQFRYVDQVHLKNVSIEKVQENMLVLENVNVFKEE